MIQNNPNEVTVNNKDKIAVNSNEVHLNIGGMIFCTSRNTLEMSDSFFRMLSLNNPSVKELPFVDRDYTHFRYILNYMRGSKILPKEPLILLELHEEADFYCLQGLKSLLYHEISDEIKKSTSIIVELKRIRERLN